MVNLFIGHGCIVDALNSSKIYLVLICGSNGSVRCGLGCSGVCTVGLDVSQVSRYDLGMSWVSSDRLWSVWCGHGDKGLLRWRGIIMVNVCLSQVTRGSIVEPGPILGGDGEPRWTWGGHGDLSRTRPGRASIRWRHSPITILIVPRVVIVNLG